MKKNEPRSEIRKHYFENRYVIIAPKRALRPGYIKETAPAGQFVGPDPFDEEPQKKLKAEYEVKQGGRWIIRVINNKYPALTLDNPKAYGKQEIIIETPEHGKHINQLSDSHVVKILETYDQRIHALMAVPKIRYVAVFKNEGGKAGASINHAHSQVIALPLIPPFITSMSQSMDQYILEKGSCPYCDVIRKERREKIRVIYDDGKAFALSPYSTSSPYGVWLMPAKHKRALEDLSAQEKISLVKALKKVLNKLDSINLAYNYFLHSSLDLENHHFRIKISPRLTTWGGLELGSGIVINPVVPEEAAKFYRGE